MNDPIQEALEEARRQAENAPEQPRGNEEAPGESWRAHLHVNEKGKLMMNLHNTVVIMRHEFSASFRFSEFECEVVDMDGKPIEDADILEMQATLQNWGLRSVARTTVQDAIDLVARDFRFHPIRDYLDDLEWDGTPRLDWLFPYYFGSLALRQGMKLDDVHPYHREIGCRFMLGLVARIYDPGCQQDYMVILEGGQGETVAPYDGLTLTPAAPAQGPPPVTLALLRRGQDRFNIFCSPCHDRTGSGNGMIVRRGFKRPTSYHSDRLRSVPIDYFYQVMTEGYGVMPSYAPQVPPEDRWAIAAYIRALQLAVERSPELKQDLEKQAGVQP